MNELYLNKHSNILKLFYKNIKAVLDTSLVFKPVCTRYRDTLKQ